MSRRKNTDLKDLVLSQLKHDCWVSCKELAGRLTIGYDRPLYYLNILRAEGKVERKKEKSARLVNNTSALRYVYRLLSDEPEETVTPANAVLPPYRNLRLSEDMVDYDRTLHRFEALCLETRK